LVDPKIDVHEAVRPDSVNTACAAAFRGDEAAVQKCPEVLTHGRAADRQPCSQFIDRLRPAPQLFQKVSPVGIGDGLESVNGHRFKVCETDFPGKSLISAGTALIISRLKGIQAAKSPGRPVRILDYRRDLAWSRRTNFWQKSL